MVKKKSIHRKRSSKKRVSRKRRSKKRSSKKRVSRKRISKRRIRKKTQKGGGLHPKHDKLKLEVKDLKNQVATLAEVVAAAAKEKIALKLSTPNKNIESKINILFQRTSDLMGHRQNGLGENAELMTMDAVNRELEVENVEGEAAREQRLRNCLATSGRCSLFSDAAQLDIERQIRRAIKSELRKRPLPNRGLRVESLEDEL